MKTDKTDKTDWRRIPELEALIDVAVPRPYGFQDRDEDALQDARDMAGYHLAIAGRCYLSESAVPEQIRDAPDSVWVRYGPSTLPEEGSVEVHVHPIGWSRATRYDPPEVRYYYPRGWWWLDQGVRSVWTDHQEFSTLVDHTVDRALAVPQHVRGSGVPSCSCGATEGLQQEPRHPRHAYAAEDGYVGALPPQTYRCAERYGCRIRQVYSDTALTEEQANAQARAIAGYLRATQGRDPADSDDVPVSVSDAPRSEWTHLVVGDPNAVREVHDSGWSRSVRYVGSSPWPTEVIYFAPPSRVGS